jgi:hypothetical protein
MLMPQYKDMILEVLALTFVVGAATIGSVAGQDSSGARMRPRSASLAPQSLVSVVGGAESADKPRSSPDEQPPEDQVEVLSVIAYSMDSADIADAGAVLESPTIEVIAIEPDGTCKVYTAWCDAEQILLKINADKEESHPSAPSPIP